MRAGVTALFVSAAQSYEIQSKKVNQHLLRKETNESPRSCSGQECVHLMDDIHYNAADDRTVRNLPAISEGLKTIYCKQGMSTCELSYSFPSGALLQAADGDHSGDGERNFYEIAKKTGTDKVDGHPPGSHHYETTYQEYLGKYSLPNADPFVMVEVGFAKGSSAKAWAEFLPKAKLHEFDVHCDEQWNVMDTSPEGIKGKHRDLGYCKLHCGDGANAAFLQESLKDDEAPLVMIDDGGHGPEEMKNTFDIMWPKVKPGGLFFIEDLAESYAVGLRMDAFVEKRLKPIVHDLLLPKPSGAKRLIGDVSSQIESIQCREQICALRKVKA